MVRLLVCAFVRVCVFFCARACYFSLCGDGFVWSVCLFVCLLVCYLLFVCAVVHLLDYLFVRVIVCVKVYLLDCLFRVYVCWCVCLFV